MGVLLCILSLLLRAILVPLAIIYGIVKLFIQSHFDRAFKYADQSFFEMAVAIDVYGNVVCKELFNDCLLKKNVRFPFGKEGQTISAILGINYLTGTLTGVGLWLNNTLNSISRNHTINAAEKLIKEQNLIL